MPFMLKPICQACGEIMPNQTILGICRQCRAKLQEDAKKRSKP